MATKKKEKTILALNPQKKGVEIVVSQREKYLIDEETYLDHYFYPGKVLSDEEVLLLKKASKNKKASDYLVLLLSRGRYTYHQLFQKLETKYPLGEKEIKSLLAPYVENGLIDDKSYALDYASSKAEQGYGRNYILDALKERGVNSTLAHSPEVMEAMDSSFEVLPDLITSLKKRKSNLSRQKQEEAIQQALLRRGYSYSEIEEALRSLKEEETPEEIEKAHEEEKLLLRNEARKWYNSFTRSPSFSTLSPMEKKKKLTEKLLRRGFPLAEVKEELDKKEEYSEL